MNDLSINLFIYTHGKDTKMKRHDWSDCLWWDVIDGHKRDERFWMWDRPFLISVKSGILEKWAWRKRKCVKEWKQDKFRKKNVQSLHTEILGDKLISKNYEYKKRMPKLLKTEWNKLYYRLPLKYVKLSYWEVWKKEVW